MQSHNHRNIPDRDDDDDSPGPYLRRLRDVPQDTVHRLEEEIGRRPATSLSEARAAAYLDGRLRRAGLRVSADTFTAHPAPGWERIVSGGLLVLALILYYWQPFVALLLQISALCLMGASIVRRGTPLIERQQPTQNVIGTRAASDQRHHRLVVLAALDTPAIPQQLSVRFGGAAIPIIRVIAALLIVAFGLIGVFDPQRLWFYLQFPPALYLIASAILDALGKRGFWPVQSADSVGLAVLLACCEALDEMLHTELWAIGLGASTAEAGLSDVLRRYPFDPATTLFIVLEGLGTGEPIFLTHDGWPSRPADSQLTTIAAQAAADPKIMIAPLAATRHATIATRLLRQGRRAITIACLGPAITPATDSAEALNRATRLVIAMARTIDSL
jgi:hypothetical protein